MKKYLLFVLLASLGTMLKSQTAQSALECFNKNDFACAEEQYTALASKEKIQKLKSEYLVNLGIAQRKQGKAALAIRTFESALQANPMSTAVYENLGSIHAQRGNKTKAIEYLSKGLKDDEEDIQLYLVRARVYDDLGKKELAIEDFNKVLNFQPDNIYALAGLANVKSNHGDFEGALKDYADLLKNKQEPLFYNGRAEVYMKQKKYKEALQDANKSILLNPKFSPSYTTKGNILLQTNKTVEACNMFNKAISLGYEKYFLSEQLSKCTPKN